MEKYFMAGIVLFNPCIEQLKINIDAVINQVNRIILIDNGSENQDEIKKLEKLIEAEYKEKVAIISNAENKGIACALNQILEYADKNDYEWFLTLDQDSICKEELLKRYVKIIAENVGQITCTIIDRKTGIIDENDKFEEIIDVPFCITSGALNNTKAIMKCGGFREILFIDGVDLDISCHLREKGYRVVKISYEGLEHELGDGKVISIMGIKLKTTNHKPWRNYYMRRNIIFVARRYFKGKEKIKMILRQFFFALGTLVLEDKKADRFKKNIKGIYDGFKMTVKE